VKRNVTLKKLVVETDDLVASGGMKRAKNPGGALQRARKSRDARVEPKRNGRVRKTAKIEILRARGWKKEFPWLVHGFSTRTGGVSTVFGGNDLNLGSTTADERKNVEENRSRFMSAMFGSGRGSSTRPGKNRQDPLGMTRYDNVVRMKQIHSSNIHVVRKASDIPQSGGKPLAGDGIITNIPGVMLTVQVADCVPILLVDVKRKVIGAIHAGWRGTVKRIAEKAVGMMQMEYGSRPRDLHAAIGPCIGACCYAVGDEVVGKFHSQFHYAAELFREVFDDDPVKKKYPLLFLTARPPGHGDTGPQVHLDLVEANRRQFIDAGIPKKNIWASGICDM